MPKLEKIGDKENIIVTPHTKQVKREVLFTLYSRYWKVDQNKVFWFNAEQLAVLKTFYRLREIGPESRKLACSSGLASSILEILEHFLRIADTDDHI